MTDYEKLGSFYLGKVYDLSTKKTKDEPLLYDSKDLVTHAVCVGMTGSGKTGLCISLIEEAAIDGIPAIIIDPKGDLTNLLLNFPTLSGKEFLPWINIDDAKQKGLSPQTFAEGQATLWKNGLASWGQDESRIKRLHDATEMLIYTPGSNAGIPVSILNTFSAPPDAIRNDDDLFRERINTTVTSLLGLIGVDADPMKSREHILLSTILHQAWSNEHNLDLANIIQQVQNPPIQKIGVLDLESFFPAKERFSLVLALNNLLASPGFNIWFQGTPLDIGDILYTKDGKPRLAIFTISHLTDPERMFFVSLLMNQILGWMRTQTGTTSLRAIVYMDEVFGFLPPIANPPSKNPMITLLKQARAFGVGLVLATQNPVDLDYKALSNAGTWFIGRLQTDRDKERLLDGLDSASSINQGAYDRQKIESMLSDLGSRVFLMSNAHEDHPELFQTRWALSYLRGPLTRDQIKTLMDPIRANVQESVESNIQQTVASQANIQKTAIPTTPALPPGITQYFLPIRSMPGTNRKLIYSPGIYGCAKIHYSNAKYHLDMTKSITFLTHVTNDVIQVNWETAQEIDIPTVDLEKNHHIEGQFNELPGSATQKKSYDAWEKEFSAWLYTTQKMELFYDAQLKQISTPGESEKEFRLRIQLAAREYRDEQVEKLREKYGLRLATLQERLRKAQQAEQKQAEQARHAKVQTAVSIGSTLLGAFTGRKLSSSTISRASSAFKGVSRSIDEGKDVARAGENTAAIQNQIDNLKLEFEAEITNIESNINSGSENIEKITIKPNKSNILVQILTLVWMPNWYDEQGGVTPAW